MCTVCWNNFKLRNIGDYQDFVKLIILLLDNDFENFRNVCVSTNNLISAISHYITAPRSLWKFMLKITRVEFELFSDFNAYLFTEKRNE